MAMLQQPAAASTRKWEAVTVWEVSGVRDDLRVYVASALGSKDRVLIVDRTGFLKKGTKWALDNIVYGDDRALRVWLVAQHQPFLLAIREDERP